MPKNTSAQLANGKTRLPPEERREQLLRVASEILARGGAERVRIPEVARAAGVTRPIVYKFFPNRKALLIAILEDFGDDLENRFRDQFSRLQSGALPEIVRGFVEVICDVIELKGPGAWYLMGSSDPDPEITGVGQQFLDRLSKPWLQEIAAVTGADQWETIALAEMIIAASWATLGLWIGGKLSREQTLEALMKGVLSLLQGFGAR